MAAINTLREKGGKIIVFLIGFSILAFVGADLLGPSSTLLGGGKSNIGEIAGTTVSYKDFLAKQDEMSFNWQQNNKKSPSSADMIAIRNITWEALISEIAFKNEYNEIGLAVSDQEVIDMVQGDNISSDIQQAFVNPDTKAFDKDKVIAFLQGLSEQTPAQRANWTNFERSLAPSRLRLKFDYLVTKTNYVTKEEAKFTYRNEANTASIKYLYVPFLPIADSTVRVSDSEIASYLSHHEEKYQKKESKRLKYVAINIIPSAQDTAYVEEKIALLKEELINTDNDSIYVVIHSDDTNPFDHYTPAQLPAALAGDDVTLGVGAIVGPIVDNGSFVVYKITKMSPSDTYSARASHILFKAASDSKEDKAKAKLAATVVLENIKQGADFADMARLHGTDGTKSKGGDLGWFADGTMVQPFEQAVYAADQKGLLSEVVETDFGYHIIEVTQVKTNVVYKIAKLSVEIYVSDETRNRFYRTAEKFALASSNEQSFDKNATQDSLLVLSAQNIDKNTRRINNISQGRSIVFWAYNTANVGDVSEVFEIDNQYIIAVLTGEQKAGVANLAAVKVELTKKIRDQKKAEIILAKLQDANGTLEDIATAYGDGASVYTMSALRLSSNSLTNVGLAPQAVGVAFSLDNGERTQAFQVDNGVLLIEMVNRVDAPDISDYAAYKTQLLQRRQGVLARNIDQVVKDLADITDNRYKFF